MLSMTQFCGDGMLPYYTIFPFNVGHTIGRDKRLPEVRVRMEALYRMNNGMIK